MEFYCSAYTQSVKGPNIIGLYEYFLYLHSLAYYRYHTNLQMTVQ